MNWKNSWKIQKIFHVLRIFLRLLVIWIWKGIFSLSKLLDHKSCSVVRFIILLLLVFDRMRSSPFLLLTKGGLEMVEMFLKNNRSIRVLSWDIMARYEQRMKNFIKVLLLFRFIFASISRDCCRKEKHICKWCVSIK